MVKDGRVHAVFTHHPWGLRNHTWILLLSIVLMGMKCVSGPSGKPMGSAAVEIDQAWWEGLSEEWRNILRINLYFHRHQVDVRQLHDEYVLALNGGDEDDRSEVRTPLHELIKEQRYRIGYQDLYAYAVRKGTPDTTGGIDLHELPALTRIYMVSGPGDLTPLRDLPALREVVLNYCGIRSAEGTHDPELDLGPLSRADELEVLHCASPALRSLEPIHALKKLRYLDCQESSVSSLKPLVALSSLETLYFGPGVDGTQVVSQLIGLRALSMVGCDQLPDMERLDRLQRLCVVEDELAIVKRRYQLVDIAPFSVLKALEVLDFEMTSYRGTLDALKGLPLLKVVTLPRVSAADVQAFRAENASCVIINAHEFE